MGGNARQAFLEQRSADLGISPEMAGQIEQHLQGFENTTGREGVSQYLQGLLPTMSATEIAPHVDGIFGAIRQGGLGEGGGGFGGSESGGDPLGN